MITSAIIKALLFPISLFLMPLRILPDVSLPTQILSSIENNFSALYFVDVVISIANLLAVLVVLLVIEAYIVGYRIVNWTIRKIPAIS